MFCIPSFDEMPNLTPYFNHVIPAYAGIQTVSHSASQVEEISETGSFTRLIRKFRRDRAAGLTLLGGVAAAAIIGNSLSFFFEHDVSLFDSLWYSLVSITTIGYGVVSADSVGARVGTILFIFVLGLTTFTAAASMMVDWILDLQYKERAGMGSVGSKSHLLIINFPNAARVSQIIEEFTEDPQHKSDEIVIVTDQIESLPSSLPNLSFVRGSPLEENTYQRANLATTRQAIVLSTGYDDPNADSVVASVVSIIEHLNPEVAIVAECLSDKHDILFAGSKRVSLIYTLQLANNLLVQEAQDPGVNLLTQAITSNRIDGTLASTKVEESSDVSKPYIEVARELLGTDINLIGVIRNGNVHLSFGDLMMEGDDSLVYISTKRHTWESLRSHLA